MPESMVIITYPSPLLRQRAVDVEEVNDQLRAVAARMAEIMYANKGVGLAAPQVGVGRRIVVLNPSGEKADEKVLINPVIVARRGAMEGEEGCLSVPGVSGTVRRNANVTVAAYDLDGNELEITASDFMARVLQHEIDHLEGMLLVDRMTPESRMAARDALKALEEAYGKAEPEAGGPH